MARLACFRIALLKKEKKNRQFIHNSVFKIFVLTFSKSIHYSCMLPSLPTLINLFIDSCISSSFPFTYLTSAADKFPSGHSAKADERARYIWLPGDSFTRATRDYVTVLIWSGWRLHELCRIYDYGAKLRLVINLFISESYLESHKKERWWRV